MKGNKAPTKGKNQEVEGKEEEKKIVVGPDLPNP